VALRADACDTAAVAAAAAADDAETLATCGCSAATCLCCHKALQVRGIPVQCFFAAGVHKVMQIVTICMHGLE
jgi:hypothetical protein